ncbi:hypothetical protein VUR80DRAFT_2079 [Thermomyces stellatus]
MVPELPAVYGLRGRSNLGDAQRGGRGRRASWNRGRGGAAEGLDREGASGIYHKPRGSKSCKSPRDVNMATVPCISRPGKGLHGRA